MAKATRSRWSPRHGVLFFFRRKRAFLAPVFAIRDGSTDRCDSAGSALKQKKLLNPAPARLPHLSCPRRVLQQGDHRGGQRLRVLVRHQQSTLLIRHHLRHSPNTGGDDWFARRHRFYQSAAKGLTPGGLNENVERGHDRRHPASPTGKQNPATERGAPDLLENFPIVVSEAGNP